MVTGDNGPPPPLGYAFFACLLGETTCRAAPRRIVFAVFVASVDPFSHRWHAVGLSKFATGSTLVFINLLKFRKSERFISTCQSSRMVVFPSPPPRVETTRRASRGACCVTAVWCLAALQDEEHDASHTGRCLALRGRERPCVPPDRQEL